MFGIGPKYVPMPPGVPYPLLWGNGDFVRQRFGSKIKDIKLTRPTWPIKLPFAEAHTVEFFSMYFGAMKGTFEALAAEPQKRNQMEKEMIEFWKKNNRATNGTLLCDAE